MYKKILVPLDGSELAECVLPHVETVAKGCGSENVTFVRVVEPFYIPINADEGYNFSARDWTRIENESKAMASNYLNQLVKKIKYDGVEIKGVILSGKAPEQIADYAARNGIDLIIIATHGRSGVNRLVFGSVADKVLHTAGVPVLMIQAPGGCKTEVQSGETAVKVKEKVT